MAAGHPVQRQGQPNPVRVWAFVDGSNLFNSAKRCFGYRHPNYDIAKLAQAVVSLEPNRQLAGTNFYIGIPKLLDDADKNVWWTKKLAAMGRTGVTVNTRYLKRRELSIKLGGLVFFEKTVPRLVEKGIDLKLGLDLVRLARNTVYDAAIVFSQDGDLVEAVEEVHSTALEQNRWIQVEACVPDPVEK